MSAAVVDLLTVEDRKRWATLQAVLTLAGYKSDCLESDTGRPIFIVSRWSATRSLMSLVEVEAFAKHVGALR